MESHWAGSFLGNRSPRQSGMPAKQYGVSLAPQRDRITLLTERRNTKGGAGPTGLVASLATVKAAVPKQVGVSVVSQSPAAEVNTVTWKLTEKVQTPVCRLGPVQGSDLHLVSSKGSGVMRTTPSGALAPLLRSSQSPLGHMAVSASSSSETWRRS